MTQIFETSTLPESGYYWIVNPAFGFRAGEPRYLKRGSPFYSLDESGFLGLENLVMPSKTIFFCNTYCKSLGYLRKGDPLTWKKCKAECRINIVKIRQGKYKISPAEANIPEPDITDIEKGADAALRTGERPEGGETNWGLIIGGIVGFLVLIAIIIALFKMFGKK